MDNSKNTVGTARLPKIKHDMADIYKRVEALRVGGDTFLIELEDLARQAGIAAYHLKQLSLDVDEAAS